MSSSSPSNLHLGIDHDQQHCHGCTLLRGSFPWPRKPARSSVAQCPPRVITQETLLGVTGPEITVSLSKLSGVLGSVNDMCAPFFSLQKGSWDLRLVFCALMLFSAPTYIPSPVFPVPRLPHYSCLCKVPLTLSGESWSPGMLSCIFLSLPPPLPTVRSSSLQAPECSSIWKEG